MRLRRIAIWATALAAALVTVLGAPGAAAEDGGTPGLGWPQPGIAAGQGGGTPRPDLGLVTRLADGGMSLWRMPLAEGFANYGRPLLVRTLSASAGFSFDRARVFAGNFGNVTSVDDGTADFVIWHAMGDGSVRVWAIGGGRDPRPKLWLTLPRPWSWANSRATVGDLNGDGWDDLIVRHRGTSADKAWALLSNGQRLGTPAALRAILLSPFPYAREVVADLDNDGSEDLLTATTTYGAGPQLTYAVESGFDGSSFTWAFNGPGGNGWSFAQSRQLSATIGVDSYDDVVTVHRAGDGGLAVWVHSNCASYDSDPVGACLSAPTRWQVLSGRSGWSYDYSRQYLGDTDGDWSNDLITVHRSSTGGLLVWRALNDGSRFGTPQLVAQLRPEQGWRWATTRDTLVDPWGIF